MSPPPSGQRIGRLAIAGLCCGLGLLLLVGPTEFGSYLNIEAVTRRPMELRAAGAVLVSFGVLLLSV